MRSGYIAPRRGFVLEPLSGQVRRKELGAAVMVGGDHTMRCLRCLLRVSVAQEQGALKLVYDFDHWRTHCCSARLEGPSACAAFVSLQELLTQLPRPPKN
jgi:hypothetical protein